MFKQLTLFFILFLFTNYLNSQINCTDPLPSTFTIPVSNHIENQLFQGPCYVFALTAAIESEFEIFDGKEYNFSEWYMYSDCVLGGQVSSYTGVPYNAIRHVIEYGIVNQNENFEITPSCSCEPSPDLSIVPCLIDCDNLPAETWCKNNKVLKGLADPGIGCSNTDCGGRIEEQGISCLNSLNSNPGPGNSNPNSLGYHRVILDNPTDQEIARAMLCNQTGVVANFDSWHRKWEGNYVAHAVFIYGFTYENGEIIFFYKDSWPVSPGFGYKSLEDMAKNGTNVRQVYYLRSVVDNNCPGSGTSCDCGRPRITGSNKICCENEETFFSTGGSSNWTVGSGLYIISGQGTNQITVGVDPNYVNYNQAPLQSSITAVSNKCNSCPPVSKQVTVYYKIFDPTGINILGDWSINNKTCPGSNLELVIQDINAYCLNTINYNWNVTGATITSGQGTSSIDIVTFSNNNTYLHFEVRAEGDNCENSEWVEVYGQTSNRNCNSGGGGPLIIQSNPFEIHQISNKLIILNDFDENIIKENAKFRLFDLIGREIELGAMNNYQIQLPLIQSGIYIIQTSQGNRIYNQKIFIDID